MFRHIYEAGASIFLLQGALLVPLLLVAVFAWVRQNARLNAVAAALGRDRAARDRTLASLLADLPKLQPLHCPSCGGALALGVDATTCTSCRSTFPPPPDYTTMSLRRRFERLTRAAQWHWYQARVLTATPVRWLLRLLVIAEPALFLVLMIGATTYSDTWLDRFFEKIGEKASFTLMLAGFGGFICWMVVFILLANLAGTLRRKLPPYPAPATDDAATSEFATCRACGGGVHYDANAFAALCGYCGVENYRAGYARHAHADAASERANTRATLFGAMEIIEDFTGTFVVVMGILILGFGLLVLWRALKT